jgi:hypothetical protein
MSAFPSYSTGTVSIGAGATSAPKSPFDPYRTIGSPERWPFQTRGSKLLLRSFYDQVRTDDVVRTQSTVLM